MKPRITLLMMALLLNVAAVWARPGYSKPVDVYQPDGTTVTLLMHGDEFHSFMTTADGYTVIRCDDGYYRYAVKQGDRLKASAFVAKNAEQRDARELAFLTGTEKMLREKMSEAGRQWKERVSRMYSANYASLQDGQHRAMTPGTLSERINYKNFKGLVVLVNWNDRQFNVQNPVEFYQKLTSQKNYTDNSKTVYPYDIKGSVRDYFYANSMQMFDPTFDVVGPVTIDYSCTYPWPKDGNNVRPEFTANCNNILKAVMAQLSTLVDFSNYDLNNDNFIDMVYIIFAGYGSYVTGNNPKYMWPHSDNYAEVRGEEAVPACDYYGFPTYNGKKFGRYACSVEIQDYEDDAVASPSNPKPHAYPDGIGTMCHEFSHVLGLADHYDTTTGSSGSNTPGPYDIMDGGADFNQGLSPVGYSAFERYVLGFADQTVKPLEQAGDYTLQPFNTSNTAYFVKTKTDGEVFYIENRQKQGWDDQLPKSGLLVWRVDTSDPSPFISNKANVGEGNEHLQVVGNAPFTETDLTPSTCTLWGDKEAAINLYGITEKDGVITFKAGQTPTAISHIAADENTSADGGAAYNLAGQRVASGYKGIIVRNGKKFLNK